MTAVEFDETGNFLATGDKGGRIVVFERNNTGVSRGHQARRERAPRMISACQPGPFKQALPPLLLLPSLLLCSHLGH